jgi:hypothetical protein
MAIDFMILPLSRYLSGDFVTPVMEMFWKQGVSYSILGLDGNREQPPGIPFGGPDAATRRFEILEMLTEDLAGLPAPIPEQLWDELWDGPMGFHRVDPDSYAAFVEEAERRGGHCAASLFLPCEFPELFEMTTPFERPTGSVPVALRELDQSWPDVVEPARETLRDALREAAHLCLPLVVDM